MDGSHQNIMEHSCWSVGSTCESKRFNTFKCRHCTNLVQIHPDS